MIGQFYSTATLSGAYTNAIEAAAESDARRRAHEKRMISEKVIKPRVSVREKLKRLMDSAVCRLRAVDADVRQLERRLD